jgi:hypothetical protein
MGSPISSYGTETFLQYFKHLVITINMHNKSGISEDRYVDDILITPLYNEI